ncbi:DUF4139 domain-containing protein [Pseudocitrobacter cyperus]|uniref:Mucoidy inhibitor MuiA family protein n=1 Tax=Pseudocitrobacter cyperus TaxID=3112843 RepID=A0ABV0HJR3_9ENTR
MFILKPLPLALLLAGASVSSAWSAQLTQPLSLKEVTVYLRGASLQSEETLNLPAGESEITFTQVADSLLSDSIAIAMDNGVTVLSSQLIQQSVQPKADLQQQLTCAKQELAELIAEKNNINAQIKVLEDNRSLTNKSAAEVGKYLQMVKERNGELLLTASKLEQRIAEKETEIDERGQQHDFSGDVYRNQIVARIYTPKAVSSHAVVRYMTPQATWVPSYDIHASAINQPLRLVYKASIRQHSGLAWKNVKLVLSTSEPDTRLTIPRLETQYVDVRDESNIISGYAGGSSSVDTAFQQSLAHKEARVRDEAYAAAKAAADAKAKSPGRYKASATKPANNFTALNVRYALTLPWQIDSDNNARTVVIKEESVSGDYRFFAIPKISNDAYLQVQINAWEDLNLIPGESQIFFGNNRTGVGYLQPPEDGKSLNIQLNRDPKLIIQRKTVQKKENAVSIFNDNAIRNFSYTLNVKNSYAEAVDLTLLDQIPVSANSDITVENVQYGQAQYNTKTGELSWKLHLAGKESTSLPFSYAVKYPKNATPSGM